MFQRIQSLYLALASAISIALIFIPFSKIVIESDVVFISIFKSLSFDSSNTWLAAIILGLSIIVTTLAIVSLWSYKKRILQNKLNAIAFLFNAFLIGGLYWMVDRYEALYMSVHYQAGALLPIVTLILLIVASRAIRKDIELLRSSERIR